MSTSTESLSDFNGENVSNKYYLIYDIMSAIVSAVLLVAFVFVFVFRPVNVEGDSMNNTLFDGEYVFTYTKHNYGCGDIVVISRPDANQKVIVKRVIATGGQTVDIDYENAVVYVDGRALDEPYVGADSFVKSVLDLDFPFTVPEGYVFCLGDNRNNSADSRQKSIGPIDEDSILGKAFIRIVPFGRFNIYDNNAEAYDND